MSILSVLFIFTLSIFSGCTPPPYQQLQPTPVCHIEEPLPCTIPIKNEANIRLPERVKAYAVNRYIDPANPRIMHERHVMYRIEEDPRWRLTTDESRQILIGNTLTNGKLNYNPVLMEKELALELQRQRLINEALQTHSEMLIDTGAALSQTQKIIQERTDHIEKSLEKQSKLSEELSKHVCPELR